MGRSLAAFFSFGSNINGSPSDDHSDVGPTFRAGESLGSG